MLDHKEVREASIGTDYEPPEGWSINEDSILFRVMRNDDVDPALFENSDIWSEVDEDDDDIQYVCAMSRSDAEIYDGGL